MIVDDGISAGEARAAVRPARFSRRSFLFGATVGLGAVALAGCSGGAMSLAQAEKHYGPKPDERFPIPGVNLNKVSAKYYRQTVRYASKEAAGTIIVDPRNHYVYRIEGDGMATRYGVSVGRAGFLWNGEAYVGRKSEWPIWTPPKEMIERQPEAAKYAGGMKPGLDNPLGARALYIFQGKEDTLYRIHGSPEWWTIGKSVSSGCVRMINQDVVDLYARVPDGTTIVVTDLSRPGVESVDDIRDREIYEPYRPDERDYVDDPDLSADASRIDSRRRRRYLDDDPRIDPGVERVYDDPYYEPGY